MPEYIRASKPTVVDGAFDPLHSGHLAYFSEAFRRFGPLTALIASDRDIRAKGREPLLPLNDRVRVIASLRGIQAAHGKQHQTTAEALEALGAARYVKGADWRGRLPADIVDACERIGCDVVYVDTPRSSSSALLGAWAIRQAESDLDGFTAWIAKQRNGETPAYDAAYFSGEWRGDAPYTLGARRQIEGKHPDIIAGLWSGRTVLDVGCGPGHLVALLRERGVDAGGIDPSAEAIALSPVPDRVTCGDVSQLPPKCADVVVCREVLEHLTIAEIPRMIGHLFRVARKAVYITTRFHHQPFSPYRVTDERDVDPTHQTLLTRPMLRSLCVLAGGTRHREWESALDWQGKGRVLCYAL